MENIMIHSTEDEPYTPSVEFNADTGICTISGESFLEEAAKFYSPLFEWIETYYKTHSKPLILNLKLSYYNTNTSKKILDLLHIVKDYANRRKETVINWYYEENDIDTVEDIEDFMQITGLKINLIPQKTDL